VRVADRVRSVLGRIEAAADRSLRDAADVRLVAVTKTVPASLIAEAIQAGVTCIGENRVQEAERKFAELTLAVEKHLVGHLQTNKVREAIALFDVIEAVDSVRLAREISTRAEASGASVDVLVEVNTSGEATKYGFEPEETADAVEQMAGLPGLRVTGLMTVGAFLADPEAVRPCFRRLRAIRDEIEERVVPGVSMRHLSMGMTNDFEVAVEEGATLVRVGRAVFGDRPSD